MSLIIGIKSKGKVLMACDSQVTIRGTRKTSSNKANYKIWHPSDFDNVLVGTVGSVREMNITKHTSGLIDELKLIKKTIDMEYISIKLVKKILSALKEHNVICNKDNILVMNNDYLIAVDDRLYQVFSDGAVIEIDEYSAIGSGSNEALASLRGSRGSGGIDRIKKAMDATIENDIFVDYPVIIGDTTSKEFKVIQNDGS